MTIVTQKQLEAVVERINTITKSPIETWKRDKNNKLKAQIGNYHLYGAYGAVALHRIVSDGGGVEEIIHLGTKRELLNCMWAYISGLTFKAEEKRKYKNDKGQTKINRGVK
jgi:hypothetical protein